MPLTITFRTIAQSSAERRGIDARELHAQLGNGTRFNDWFADRIKEYDLAEGRDFYSISSKTPGKTGRPRKDYLLTLTTAKELAMVERTDAGRAIRRYLIDLEERVARGDVTLAAEIADRASEADQEWLAARMNGKVARSRFTKTLQTHGVEGRGYGDCTNEIYQPIVGGKADEYRRQHHLKPRASIRDALPLKQLLAVGLAEVIAAERIETKSAEGNARCRLECSRAALTVASSLLAR